MVRLPRRLPGLRFEPVAPALAEALPRMDVAAFVGFAASGPIDVPVPVEDIAHFHALFGEDTALAWDAARGRALRGALAPAVRAFFRNGGVRCWVVRVARRPEEGLEGAHANRFALDGLWRYQPGSSVLQPAWALARSEGSWSDALDVATALSSSAVPVLASGSALRSASDAPEALVLGLGAPASGPLTVGDLLRLTFPGESRVAYAPIAAVSPLAAGESHVRGLGRGGQQRVVTAPVLWLDASASGPPVAAAAPHAAAGLAPLRCERLGFELWWRFGNGQPLRLSELGVCPGHPRYWGALPRDFDLFAERDVAVDSAPDARRPSDDGAEPYRVLWREAAEPRVPLAGGGEIDGFFVPWGMRPLPERWAGSGAQPGEELRRDGLARFDAALFLDPDLVEVGVTDLAATAEYLRYQAPSPRRLRGVHALWGVEEATLIAVPDALHGTWQPFSSPPPEPPPPNSAVAAPDACCPGDPGIFLACDRQLPPAPSLEAPALADATGSYTLRWSEVEGATYMLAEALRLAPVDGGASSLPAALTYADEALLEQGARTASSFWGRAPGDYYYRVRASVDGVAGPWSQGRIVRVPPAASYRLDDSFRPDTLLAVQRALLRLAAARGDLLAVLALPEHYLEEDAAAHANLLGSAVAEPTEGVAPLGLAETPALSHAVLYYPWLIGREENRLEELRSTPPDGAAAGLFARRTLARGAWVAPANEALAGVVALARRASEARLQSLYDAQINVLRQEPRGFLALAADTLALEDEVVPVNVRRLLALLRRAALARGQEYVFEPNDPAFRRLIERGFEALLGDLYERGAFAGAKPEQAFQVVTGSEINTPAAVELGRFYVDLKVAPAVPLAFLTVRLVQSGDRSQVTEER